MWGRRFYKYCSVAGLDPIRTLSLNDAFTFAASFVGSRTHRHLDMSGRRPARVALHAWSCALAVLGHSVPDWSPAPQGRTLPTGILAKYRDQRIRHGGVSESTLVKDAEVVSAFLAYLRTRRRRLTSVRIADIDSFVAEISSRWARRTVCTACSTLRVFLRYLVRTGEIRNDVASNVVAPRVKPMDRPPRTLPWSDARRLLRAVPVKQPGGRRDYAMLLLMLTYGLGAGEVMGLKIDDIRWEAAILRVCRPKTGVTVELPLLPAVARSLAAYLRYERPIHCAAQEIFVSKALPHSRIVATGSIYYMVQKHARAAGIDALHLGSHTLRHTYACRQIDTGASAKVVGDILGHQYPSSTSAYIRVALSRLRQVALPVPR
jgi:site-specific recombinase XerD